MKIDLYTKLILLIIAVALWGILLRPLFRSENATASNAVLDVNIKQIDGRNVIGSLDVNIKKVNGRVFSGPNVPISIKK